MAATLRLDRIPPAARGRAEPFFEELAGIAGQGLHSLYLVGSAVTTDWLPGRSDINSLLVLREMSLPVLEAIAPLGRRFGGTDVAPPLVLDEAHVAASLDAFPMEFLEMQLIHETIAGEDLLAGLVIDRGDLRRQCEREVKSRLIGLRQRYLRAYGEPGAIAEALVRFLAGYQPLVHAVLVLLGREAPLRRAEAFAALADAVGPDAAVFGEMQAIREGRAEPDDPAVLDLFERCHRATERLGRVLDGLAV